MEPETTLQLLKSIVPAAENNINTKFIVLDKARVALEGQHKTCLALVADETAAVHFQLWGDECDAVEAGDILVLTKGIFSYSRNSLLLRAGKRGKVEKVGEFTMPFVETPNLSEIQWARDPQPPHNAPIMDINNLGLDDLDGYAVISSLCVGCRILIWTYFETGSTREDQKIDMPLFNENNIPPFI